MRKQLSSVLAAMLMVSGCSQLPSMSSLNPFSDDAAAEVEKEAPVEEIVGVNPYLWQAALGKLAFMPLASADSAGGVIITDWAAMFLPLSAQRFAKPLKPNAQGVKNDHSISRR